MFGKIKLTSLLAVASLLLAAASAGALTSSGVCPTPYAPAGNTTSAWYGPYGSGSHLIYVAVAANFTQPLDAFLTTYFVPTYGTTDQLYFCADSTSNLEATIGTNGSGGPGATNPYTMLFAADSSPSTKYSAISIKPYLYAYGVPVFFGYLSGNGFTNYISSQSDLITTGTGCTINANHQITNAPSALSACTISGTLTGKSKSVTIANPLKAPYGNDAANILDLTAPIYPQTTYSIPVGTAISPAKNIATETDPTWLVLSTTNANITAAFNAVGKTTVYAGFAAMSQVCKIESKVAFVQFSNSSFILSQTAASFAANDLNTQIKGQIGNKTWDGFITQWCYQPI